MFGSIKSAVTSAVTGAVTSFVSSKIPSVLSGVIPQQSQNNQPGKFFLTKYQVKSLIIKKGEDKIEMDHSNILSIEYQNDYEFNIMAMLKVTLRVDVRKRIWILKHKKDITVKFELNKIGMDVDLEDYTTSPEVVWNLEFVPHFNDDDESSDVEVMEQRIAMNEGAEFKSNDLGTENYHETQNVMDIYLFHPKLLKASRFSFNKIYEKDTLQNMVAQMLTESKHQDVLMSKFENDEVYSELLIPANPVYKCLIYLDQYFGFYKKGAIIFYDIDCLYILNSNGKVTAKKEEEWTEVTFLVTKLDASVPGNAVVRKEGEKKYYVQLSEMDVSPQRFTIGKNAQLGSEAKMVITNDTEIEVEQAEQSYIDDRNKAITFIKKDNKYTPEVIRTRMEENEAIIYISGENFDISAFRPNKEYKIVFDEQLKHKQYGNNKYRLAYAYHYIKLEGEGYMSSSHRIILKKTEGEVPGSNNNSQ
jgi:hypothetical protein